MTRKERAEKIGKILDELYPVLDVPLYHKDPYTLLIAVLLSAQATDRKVNEITPILFEKADNPWEMARLSVEEVRSEVRRVGKECRYGRWPKHEIQNGRTGRERWRER